MYRLMCTQCEQPIGEGMGYWSLVPHVNKRHYTLSELERDSMDFCSRDCFQWWWETHAEAPEAYFKQQPRRGAGARRRDDE
jgi:hypothetical protein